MAKPTTTKPTVAAAAETDPLHAATLTLAGHYIGKDKAAIFGLDFITDFLLSLVDGCLGARSEEEAVEAIKDPGITEHFALRRAARAATRNDRDAKRLREAALRTGREMSREQIAGCYRAARAMAATAD